MGLRLRSEAGHGLTDVLEAGHDEAEFKANRIPALPPGGAAASRRCAQNHRTVNHRKPQRPASERRFPSSPSSLAEISMLRREVFLSQNLHAKLEGRCFCLKQ